MIRRVRRRRHEPADSLSDRDALRNIVEQCAAALDTRDGALLAAQFTADASMLVWDVGDDPHGPPRRTRTGHAELASGAASLSMFRATMHVLGQQRIIASTDGAASAETYCVAHHWSAEDPQKCLTIYARYIDDFIRDSAGWRISMRKTVFEWSEHRTAGGPSHDR
jgi:hypothetical protein